MEGNETKKKRRAELLVIVPTVTIVLAVALGRLYFRADRFTWPNDDVELGLNVGALLAKAPKQISEHLRLDRVVAGPGHRLTNVYKLTGWTSADVPRGHIDKLVNGVTRRECSTPDVVDLLAKGVTVVLEYHDTDGQLIGTYQITSQSCKGK